MLNSVNKYKYYKKKNSKKNKIFLLFILGVIIIGLFISLLFLYNQKVGSEIIEVEIDKNLIDLWNDGLYSEVIMISKQKLKINPIETETLMYSGFAYYSLAYYEDSLEEKLKLINNAIIAIRRSKLSPSLIYEAETDYMLGKSYIEKEVIIKNGQRKYIGKFYPDLAIQYLEKSIERGYIGKDTYEYLGLAYSAIDNQEKVIVSFENAYELNNLDKYILAIGKAYLELEDFDNAEQYLLKTLNESETSDTEKECRFALSEIYMNRNELLKAEEQYLAIIEIDPASAEAHFQLGEIYTSLNDPVRARAEYRKTLLIDPNHYGARLRYYK